MSRTVLGYFVPTEHRRLNESIGLLLAVISILIALSLVSFNPDDPSFNIARSPALGEKPANFAGVLGAYLADGFFQLLGFSSYLIPIFLGVYAFYWLASWPVRAVVARTTGAVLLILTLSAMMSWSTSFPRVGGQLLAGGLFGRMIEDNLESLVNPAGAAVLLIAAFFGSLFLTTKFSFEWALGILKPRFAFISAWIDRYADWQAERKAADLRRKAEQRKIPKKQMIAQMKERVVTTAKDVEPEIAFPPEPTQELPRVYKPASIIAPSQLASAPRAAVAMAKTTTKPGETTLAQLPPTNLLNVPVALAPINEEELRQRALSVESKCREFEVDGTVQHIHPGPVVTTFEFKPEPGIKYSKITGLGDDLCLALEAESVRIDRMPGKSTVGIEVPNDKRATIMLRELLESTEYGHSNYKLPLALGKDITGKLVVSDLQKMPHLLTAGSTGTGKSVSINAMILSLLYHSRPDQMKMILIDPKRLELGLYQDIPHLLVPVVTEPKIAQNALRWAVVEMETRYKKLAKRGVRNLEAYNEQIKQLPLPGLGVESSDLDNERDPLPYIVIVIDELADLMMTAAREVEEYITRLAQMARAVGIHLILATQRPSVDVITGLIKANFPARVSFRVATKTDSRTILDSNGAEQLLGRGDMLFLPPGSARLMRVHGPLITEDEVIKVVDFLKTQGKPIYNERILAEPDEEAAEGLETDGELDELYTDAVNVVLEMGKASTSALQRRLRVGYGRAASLIDGMERAGIVGPADGSKPRAVLIKREDFFSE
jgi:DNA segregation ATPase FtsK/SpoIIIE, S-DNA-T family